MTDMDERLERAALQQLQVPIVLISPELTVASVNDAARQLFRLGEGLKGSPASALNATVIQERKIGLSGYLALARDTLQLARCKAPGSALHNRDTLSVSMNASIEDNYWRTETFDGLSVIMTRVNINRRDAVGFDDHTDSLPAREIPHVADMTVKLLEVDAKDYLILSFESVHAQDPVDAPSRKASLQMSPPEDDTNGTAPPADFVDRMKMSFFDNHERPAYFLTADEKWFFPNKALIAMRKTPVPASGAWEFHEYCHRFTVHDAEFKRRIPPDEYPGIRMVRNRQNFSSMTCGFVDVQTGKKTVADMRGECVYDLKTGDFLGEEFTDLSTFQEGRWVKSHEAICDCESCYCLTSIERELIELALPHIVWYCDPHGNLEYASKRWYDYTGFTEEETLGQGWQNAVHTDDRQVSSRLRHLWLATSTPLVDSVTNQVVRYYGTSTDIHELKLARLREQHMNEQCSALLAHANLHLFAVDRRAHFTMSRGAMQRQYAAGDDETQAGFIGEDLLEVLARPKASSGKFSLSGCENALAAVKRVLERELPLAVSETKVAERWFRTTYIADTTRDLLPESPGLEGPFFQPTLGISLDVTDLKTRAALEIENTRLQVSWQPLALKAFSGRTTPTLTVARWKNKLRSMPTT
ncbi:hypothetical protein MRB53_038633 [Persea americana]|nr:hypothetical protein MRB53_038633 [Persea americana]